MSSGSVLSFLPPQGYNYSNRDVEKGQVISDAQAREIKSFYKEYTRVVKKCLRPNNQVCMISILMKLHFIDDRRCNSTPEKLCQLLKRY